MSDSIVYLACSALQPELEHLAAAERVDAQMHFLDSGLHRYPGPMEQVLTRRIERLRDPARPLVLVYGDCHPMLGRWTDGRGVVRVRAADCIEMLLGRARRKQLLREGAFFLFPEWVRRWRELLVELPGLDAENTRDIFRDQHRKMVYVDTGVRDIPQEDLEACCAHFGLPLAIEPATLDHLEDLLKAAEARLSGR